MNRQISLFITLQLAFSLPGFAQVWSEAGGGTGTPVQAGNVYSLGTYQNALYVGGEFRTVGDTVPARRIARWDSLQWAGLNTDTLMGGSFVFALQEYNGELYFAGQESNTFPFKGIARWNGASWDTIGTGIDGYAIQALEVYNNELYAGGVFNSINGVSANNIARWDGVQWKAVGGGVTGGLGGVRCMEVYQGELYVGGGFNFAGGMSAFYIARWDGVQWDTVGTGLWASAWAMTVDTVKDVLYVGGLFTMVDDTTTAWFVAQWDGSQWSALPGSEMISGIKSLAMYRGELYAGGDGGFVADTFLARWDGYQWHPIVPDPNGSVKAMEVYKDELYVGGSFQTIGPDSMKHIARWYLPGNCAYYPTASFVTDSDTVAPGDTLFITENSIITPGDSIVQWWWIFGDASTSSAQAPGFHIYSSENTYTLELAITNLDGCTSRVSKTIVVDDGTGVEKQKAVESWQLAIYPNPTDGSFTVEVGREWPVKNSQLKIYDLKGREIASHALGAVAITGSRKKLTIETSGWAEGVYICKLEVKGNVLASGKVVVSR